MNLEIPEPGDRRDRTPSRREKTFEDLMRDLQPELNKLPDDIRIPAVPPNEDAATEVQAYVRETMGLPVACDVPNWILVGNESLERSKIREGRIGETGRVYVFAFLYPYEGNFRTVFVYPRDGIDPRMIAKAVLWGQVSEIPSSLAQTEIGTVASFFSLDCVDFKKLVDAPLLAKARSDWQDYFGKENRELQGRLEWANRQIEQLEAARVAATQAHEKREKELTETWMSYNLSTEIWKLVSFVFGSLFVVVAIRLHLLWRSLAASV